MLVKYDVSKLDEYKNFDYQPFKKYLQFSKYAKINSKDLGEINFSPDVWFISQWILVYLLFQALKGNEIREFVILKPRQMGATTQLETFDLFYTMYNKLMRAVIVGNDDATTSGMRRDIVKYIWKSLPPSMKLPILSDTRDITVFASAENKKFGSFIEYRHPITRGNKGNLGRSRSYNYAHLTEIAYYPNIDDLNSITPAFSQEHPKRLYIYESTANGFNHFYELYETAKESNTKMAIFLGWWLKDSYRITNDRDLIKYGKNPNSDELERIDLVKSLYGYEIQIEQLAWWRKYKEEYLTVPVDKSSSKDDYMLEVFPFVEYDAFRMSSTQVFMPKVLQEAEKKVKNPVTAYEPIFFDDPTETVLEENRNSKLKIWEKPKDGVRYVIAADPAWSVNPESDYSVFTVLKCFRDKTEEVAKYASNTVDIKHFTWLFLITAGWYNAMMNYEVVGGGEAMRAYILNFEKEILRDRAHFQPDKDDTKITIWRFLQKVSMPQTRTYLYKRLDSLSSRSAVGWVTTANNKERLIILLKEAFYNGQLIINDPLLLEEMRWFLRDTLSAQRGKHDDRIMSVALAYNTYVELIRNTVPTEREWLEKDKKPTETTALNSFYQRIVNKTKKTYGG